MKTTSAIILILIVAAPVLFVNLGGRDLWAPDEPRFAEIGREMLRTGNWVVPRMNGQDIALLPPMTYWLVALPSAVRGEVTEFTARVLIALLGLVGALATFALGRRMYGNRVGALSAIVLVTSFKYLWQARWLQADMPLAAFTTLALLFFYCGLRAERRKWIYYHLFCAMMALAVLCKGPLGVALPGLVILPYLTLTRSWRRISEMCIPTGILLFLLIVVPWYVGVGVWGGKAFLREVVIKHNFGMFFNTWSHKEPFYFYLPHAFWLMMPWSLFLFPALYHIIAVREHREEKIFLLSWLVVQFVFFSASQAKQEKYLLPLFPAAAIVIGKGWADYIGGAMSDGARNAMTVVGVVTAGLLVLIGLAGPAAPAAFVAAGKYTPDMAKLVAISLPMCSIVVLAVVPLVLLLRGRPRGAFAALTVLTVLASLYAHAVAMDRFDSFKSAKDFCDKVVKAIGPDEPLGIYGIAFRQTGAYLFYTGRPLVMFEAEESRASEEDENKAKKRGEQFLLNDLAAFLNRPEPAACIVKDSYLAAVQRAANVEVLLTEGVGHRQVHPVCNGKRAEKGAPKS